jgi:hypothetical protein
MQINVGAKTGKLIKDCMKNGGFDSPEAVVAAALESLQQQRSFGDFQPGELDQLLKEGERSGKPLDGEQVFKELRALRKRKKAG